MAQREPMAVYSPMGYWMMPKAPQEEYPPFVPGMGRPAWLGPQGQPQPGQMPQQMMDPRAQQAIAQMQAQAIQQPMPGDMPPGAPMPPPMSQNTGGPQAFANGDPNSPTGQRPQGAPLAPGGAMPSTTPDLIQTAMAPVGGSAGPAPDIYGYPTGEETSPTAPPGQPPSAARGVVEEMMAGNRGDKAPWLALAAAGFGTAAGTSPHALTNIGQGGLKGIEMYDRMSDRAARDRLAAATSMLGVEQQDRQAGFRERELGQGDTRLRQGARQIEAEDRNRQEQRAIDRDKQGFEVRKFEEGAPERRAGVDLKSAQAEYYRDAKTAGAQGQQEARVAQIIQRVDTTAANIANAKHGKDPAMRDNDAWQETFETERRRIAEANKLPLEMLGLDSSVPAPMNPKARKAGTVYQTPKGPMTWTGTGWLPQ